jgi:hypothetical protein
MDDLRESYRLLELELGATPDELKRAYRDHDKVWHPDRFAGDPRLQSRAQEKLKQINLAYDQATAPRVMLPPRSSAAPPPAPRRPEPPIWSTNFQRPATDEPPPSETETAPQTRPKRNWEPTIVRVAISLFIAFQLAASVILVTLIKTVLAAKP